MERRGSSKTNILTLQLAENKELRRIKYENLRVKLALYEDSIAIQRYFQSFLQSKKDPIYGIGKRSDRKNEKF